MSTDLNEIVSVTMENGIVVEMGRGTFNDAMRLGLHAFVIRVGRTVRSVAFRSYAGRSFDGTILKEFINLIGVYPVGSLVRLTDGRVGVVMATAPEPGDPTRPRVRLVRDENGEAVVGPDLDLTHDPGAPAIVEVLDPEKAGIDPSPCFA